MSRTIGLECIVEIHENERYWVGKGFGKGGLLPSDPGAFSTPDGSISWKTAEEAAEDLLVLGRGWVYYKSGDGFEDHDGWMYAKDFRPDSLDNAQPEKGALHWVRFRRLTRVKVFNPVEFVDQQTFEECDHCDSLAIEKLSKALLEVLAYCSLLHNTTHVSDSFLLPLKKTVVELALDQKPSEDPNVDVLLQLDRVRKELENFVEKERSVTKMSRLLGGVEFSYYGRVGQKLFQQRCSAVTARCFPPYERDAISGLIVRKLDRLYKVHCNQVGCGGTCPFKRVECPNEGCTAAMSQTYLEKHEEDCPYRAVHCKCGDTLKAHELPGHLKEACRLRVVVCPFQHIGCLKQVAAGDLQKHVLDDSAAHLLLAVSCMQEQQTTIRSLQSQIEALALQNKDLSTALKEHADGSTKDISKLQTSVIKTAKDLGRLENTCKKEFKRINDPRYQLHK